MDRFDSDWVQERDRQVLDYAEKVLKRVIGLEQQVASLTLAAKGRQDAELKSQAAQQQAQGGLKDPQTGNLAQQNLYAPLRSDTRAVVEMAAFVRKVASETGYFDLTVRELAAEAQEILKRST